MRKLLSIVGTGVLLLTLAPAALAASPVVSPSRSSGSIVGIAVANGNFTTLVAAVGCADPAVAAALTSGEQLTVFAPTDAAFLASPFGPLTAANICTVPQGVLTDILLYHVETGRHFSNSVLPRKAGQSKTIDTLPWPVVQGQCERSDQDDQWADHSDDRCGQHRRHERSHPRRRRGPRSVALVAAARPAAGSLIRSFPPTKPAWQGARSASSRQGRRHPSTRVSARTLVETRCVRTMCVHRVSGHDNALIHVPGGYRPMIDQQPTTIDPQPLNTTVVSLTDAAVSKLSELTKEETNPDIGLRVYVYSGGCSGFRYGMMLEDAPTPEDRVLEVSGIKVYVDGQSVDLLKGSQIDYVDTLMGAGFTVNNPNAVAACGCGSSFRTADDGGAPKGCAH